MPQHRVELTKASLMGTTEVTVGQFKQFVDATNYLTQAEQIGFGNSSELHLDDKVTRETKQMTWRMPDYAVDDDSPVSQVTWNDAVMFCNWLSDREGLKPCYRQDAKEGWLLAASGDGYRLPTEAEWEFACRAGTTTQFSFGDDAAELPQHAWFNRMEGAGRAVAKKKPNPFGLHDMHGDLTEWCSDLYAGSWYEKTPLIDPVRPVNGSYRVHCGGDRYYTAVHCRSATRHSSSPTTRNSVTGFRCVRVSTSGAGTATSTALKNGRRDPCGGSV